MLRNLARCKSQYELLGGASLSECLVYHVTDRNGKRWWKYTHLLLLQPQVVQLRCIYVYIHGSAAGELKCCTINRGSNNNCVFFFSWSCGIFFPIQTNQIWTKYEYFAGCERYIVRLFPSTLSSSSLNCVSPSNCRMLNSPAVITYCCSCHHGSKFSIIFFFLAVFLCVHSCHIHSQTHLAVVWEGCPWAVPCPAEEQSTCEQNSNAAAEKGYYAGISILLSL